MEREEIECELATTYDDLVDYLLEKYGPAMYSYFVNNSFRTRNRKVSRASEGLHCHHIDEDKAIKLSDPKMAVYYPFEYQEASRLVYCNALEHLILHIKIMQKPHSLSSHLNMMGIGGLLNICWGINDYYNGYQYKLKSKKEFYGVIKDNFEDYIYILKTLLSYVEKEPENDGLINKRNLSLSWNGTVIKKVYDRL